MKSYTITIAPDDATGATAVIHVAVNDSGPLLKGFSLVPSEGSILSTADLTQFNSERLLSAVLPAATFMPTTAQPVEEAARPVEPAITAPVPHRASALKSPAAKKRATASTRARVDKRRTAAVKPIDEKVAVGEAGGRNYRVMPDDFFDHYGKNTMAGLAAQYDVPLYTVQSWISTARRQGKLPPARKRKPRA